MSKALILGSPNCGKSLLFNRLTGLTHTVVNFPGITVDVSSAPAVANANLQLLDFPGVYSLQPISEEETVAVKEFNRALADESLKLAVCILDATRLEKGIYFALQVVRACREKGKRVLIVANMIDVLKRHSMHLDTEGLSKALNASVLPVSAKTGEGLDALEAELKDGSVSNHQNGQEVPGGSDEDLRERAHQIASKFGPKDDLLIKTHEKLDAFFLHSMFGSIVFFLIMYLLFQSIFTWAAPAMDAVEFGLGSIASLILPFISIQVLHDFTKDALFGGIGAFLVFVPQIFVLTLVVGILEDSGYLARAAVICHKPLRLFGLSGKSFVPMLSGVACAIPGIYAARTVESRRTRWLTYLAIPLMPCSARLPIYTLLIAAFIPAHKALGGLIGWQGLAMFVMYFFGLFCGLLITAAVSKARPHLQTDLPFVLEMPPYRLPSWRPLLRHAWNRSKHFVTKAGRIIFTVTVAVWVLAYFPNYGADMGSSWLGALAKVIEPVFEPLGLDWKYGVAILTSFLAREVFVATLGTLFGIDGAADNVTSLAEQIQLSGLTLASGVALLVFFAIALQCVSTLAILQKETGSWKLPAQMFAAYGIIAYSSALILYQVIRLVT